ncbi:MAG TPA: amidohydrolase family protein [Terracidiphilus sp.]|nr:amidohydrolase family protein [Terracidiphilus sp.]
MSSFANQQIFGEAAGWNVWDVNVRVGPSGPHGQVGMSKTELLEEMSSFFIQKAVAAHGTGVEYDAAVGNEALARTEDPRLIPAWTPLPDRESVEHLAKRRPKAVRLMPKNLNHSYPLTAWGAGELFEYLQSHQVVTLVAREDIDWEPLVDLLENFPRLPLVLLDIGYRFDHYIVPLLQRFPSLHFDSATYLAYRQLENFVDRHGGERLLFGSRLPLFTPATALGVMASARIPDEARLQIAGGNLRRLLEAAQNGAAR